MKNYIGPHFHVPVKKSSGQPKIKRLQATRTQICRRGNQSYCRTRVLALVLALVPGLLPDTNQTKVADPSGGPQPYCRTLALGQSARLQCLPLCRTLVPSPSTWRSPRRQVSNTCTSGFHICTSSRRRPGIRFHQSGNSGKLGRLKNHDPQTSQPPVISETH